MKNRSTCNFSLQLNALLDKQVTKVIPSLAWYISLSKLVVLVSLGTIDLSAGMKLLILQVMHHSELIVVGKFMNQRIIIAISNLYRLIFQRIREI